MRSWKNTSWAGAVRSAKGAVPEGKTEKLGGGALRQKRKVRGRRPKEKAKSEGDGARDFLKGRGPIFLLRSRSFSKISQGELKGESGPRNAPRRNGLRAGIRLF